VTSPASRRPDHGFTGERPCRACGRAVESVLSGERCERLPRYLSGALRHFPDDAGLCPDDHGWADYAALASAVCSQSPWASAVHLAAVVTTDPKGRLERDET
jgi:putative RNA 2'-phosphotransferase